MSLTRKQKKYLKKNLKKTPIPQIASHLGVSTYEIEEYLKKRWGKVKYQKFLDQAIKRPTKIDLDKRVLSFNFSPWFEKNKKALLFLTLLVFIGYVNSLGNDFVSDDIGGILQNEELNKVSYIFANPPVFLQRFLFFAVNKIFGRLPFFYRLANLLFHLGTVLTGYLLLSLLIDLKTAFFAASLLAVHPIQTEAVTWISGGIYSQYSFFLILALLMYLLSFKQQKFYLLSIVSFIAALISSEKAMAFPFILLTFMLAFESIRKSWKKILIPFVIGGLWVLFYLGKVPQRVSDLQIDHYQQPQTLNPFYQIPIAITSYLKLIFWPKNLTLYHSELSFTQVEFFLRFIIFVTFLGLIIWGYKRNRQIFFWLSFFVISLSPTLTPFGISWIVAERYVYFGAVGIFVIIAMAFQKLSQIKKLEIVSYVLFCLMILGLTPRTILRNIDWKNQDNLWLATAKTSPSSPQNHNNLGDYYGRHGNFEKAVEEFKKAIELKSGYADAYHNLANTYRQIGKNDLAIENYQKAIEFNPNLWQSYQNLAALYFEQEKFDRALESLKTAININPQNSELYTNLGVLYKKMGQQDEAKKILQTALAIDPQNQKAKQLLLSIQ